MRESEVAQSCPTQSDLMHCSLAGTSVYGSFQARVLEWVAISCSGMSNFLWPHGLQHAGLPCPSPTPRAYSKSYPLSQWCHPTILSLSSPSPPALNLSQHQGFFQWVSSSHQVAEVWNFSVSPSNEYSWLVYFRIDCWISLQSKGISRVFSNTTVWKHQFFSAQPTLTSIYDYWKNHNFD